MKNSTIFLLVGTAIQTSLMTYGEIDVPEFRYEVPIDHTGMTYQFIDDLTVGKGVTLIKDGFSEQLFVLDSGETKPTLSVKNDATLLVYGNQTFVGAGADGLLAYSKNGFDWKKQYWDGETLQQTRSTQARQYVKSLIYHDAHQHFFVEYSTGKILASPDGESWFLWGNAYEGDTLPTDEFPKRSTNLLTFKDQGEYLRFENDLANMRWLVSHSFDHENWNFIGEINLGPLENLTYTSTQDLEPRSVRKNGKWYGIISNRLFWVNVDGPVSEGESRLYFNNENLTENSQQAAFSHGRSMHNLFLSSTGQTSKDGKNWLEGANPFVGHVRFSEEYDRFVIFTEDRVLVTYDNTKISEVVNFDDFILDDMVLNEGYILFQGSGEYPLRVTPYAIESLDAYHEGNPLPTTQDISGINWSEVGDIKKIIAHNGYFFMATNAPTETQSNSTLYRSLDGRSWEQVFETQDYSYITALLSYRGQLIMSSRNHWAVHRTGISPPEGVDLKSEILFSKSGDVWEVKSDARIFDRKPSVNGPYLIDFGHLNGIWDAGSPYIAREGPDIEALNRTGIGSLAQVTWALGRYHAFVGDRTSIPYSYARTEFMGFKDAEYYRLAAEQGGEEKPIWINTGWFGIVAPNHYPEVEHQTFGSIRYLVSPTIPEETHHVISDTWGVIQLRPENSPYVTNLADGNIYFVNYAAGATLNGEKSLRFYNHSNNQWTERMESESYGFTKWYEIFKSQIVTTQQHAQLTLNASASVDVIEATKQLRLTEQSLQFARAYHVITSRTLEESDIPDKPFWTSDVAFIANVAEEAYQNALSAYLSNIGN